MDFNVHESSASRIFREVEDVFIHSGRFDLPRKLPHGHTLKAQIIIQWQTGFILDVKTCKGSIHDFSLYKQTCPDWLPTNTSYLVDSGYQGIAKQHDHTFIPFTKPKCGELLALCKQANQYLAKCRILVEPKIGLIKL